MNKRYTEKGNVLFLILIAVALFAALSYAVTQSSRSGGSDASDETNLISSAEITQYPASVRTAILRMVVSDGVDVTALEFNPPSDFDDLSDDGNGVFHPDGGGATYTTASTDVMIQGDSALNPSGFWFFSGHYEIEYIGTSDGAASAAGNEITAFLPGIKDSICTKINNELGISSATDHASDLTPEVDAQYMDDGYSIPGVGTVVIGAAAGDESLAGQPFGCVTDSAGDNIYYHVLVER